MQLKYSSNQKFQLDAINAVVGCFEGMTMSSRLEHNQLKILQYIGNNLEVDRAVLDDNIRKIQSKHGIVNINGLENNQMSFPNFSVEMETGTGKTYVYLRTILELNKVYGWMKYIIVVPSIAIREGVLKTLETTKSHFKELYENKPYRYAVYDSNSLTQVRQFATSNSVEILVMIIDSFNKAGNIINQSTDRLGGDVPIELLQKTKPILILDEPQNMESELSKRSLEKLNPLFALRYSATHKNPYTLLYRLTPADAYKEGLVKKIEVASFTTQDNISDAFVTLDSVESIKNIITAKVSVNVLMKSGQVVQKQITVKPNESLHKKTSLEQYRGFDIEEIDPSFKTILFTNGVRLSIGEKQGADKEAVFREQIKDTIRRHFDKQRTLHDSGIKVLSLFFIDKVDNYIHQDSLIRRLFNEAFNEIKSNYPTWKDKNPENCQSGYFARKTTRDGKQEMLDSSGKTKEDNEAFNLIMKDKERLLSFGEPVCFIFSHSALREGWDNPNIYQICTLNQTVSTMKKRQEIGRGMRLAINQDGERVFEPEKNILTVVANQSYEKYVSTLQQEIEDEFGRTGLPPAPADARKRKIARLRKEYTLKPEFRELWERISQKTRYAIKLDTSQLVSSVKDAIDAIDITPPKIRKDVAGVAIDDEGKFTPTLKGGKDIELTSISQAFNIVDIMQDYMETMAPQMRLTRKTLWEIASSYTAKESICINPQEFALKAVKIIKHNLAGLLINGIYYEKIDQHYEMSQLDDQFESWENYLVPTQRSIYDHVEFDSNIEKEFVEGLEHRQDVKMYIKLPGWFTVPTPVGKYNPDWAIVMDERDEFGNATGKPLLYLVRETKGSADNLRLEEQQKTDCGKKHFQDALGVSYKIVTAASELP